MMGRYVLLEFDDDATAETLCARINAATASGKPYKVIGIFQRPPTKRCECVQPEADASHRRTWVRRHLRTGFWYCTNCRRVKKGWQGPRNFLDTDPDYFGKGWRKEASLALDQQGRPIRNFPIHEGMSQSR